VKNNDDQNNYDTNEEGNDEFPEHGDDCITRIEHDDAQKTVGGNENLGF
jgi:hypothetical protein